MCKPGAPYKNALSLQQNVSPVLGLVPAAMSLTTIMGVFSNKRAARSAWKIH